MATVYLAEDLKHKRKVAVKVLRPELAAVLGAERFVQEITTTANLQHPHILPLHDSGDVDGFLYYVMPFIDGETLRDKLNRETQLGIDEAVKITTEVADALHYAHGAGVIHRDIKPENILIHNGRPMVADFGIALAVSAAAGGRMTETGLSLGTPHYMSPEQATAEKDLTNRSDIYSLGSVLYEMLTGEPPHTGGSAQAIIMKIVTEPVDPVTKIRKSVPPHVAAATAKSLEKLAADRFESAAKFAEALTTGMVRVQTLGSRRWRTAGQRLGLALGVSLGVLAAVAGVWYLTGAGGGTDIHDRSIAVLPFETLGQEKATAFTDGVHGDLLTRLSSVSDLSVTSRTSVMRYRTPDKPLPTIARELGVTWVLRGEVQETDDEVQVSARLVNARTDRQVWAQSYRRELTAENLFEIQSEITREIARALETQLSPAEEQQVQRQPTEDLDAYRLYAQGRRQLDQRTEDGMRRAAEYFRQAIARDSSYALAWVGLADALALLAGYGHADPDRVLPRAGDAARRALELWPDLAEAHASLGLLHITRHEGPAAIQELERAVELRPSYAEAHNWLSYLHQLLGRPNDALESAKRAVELNPLSPEAVSNLSLSYIANGEYEKALIEARRVRELHSDWATGLLYEGLALYHLGRFTEAQSVLRNLSVPWAGLGPRATLALALVASGDSSGARELLARIEEAADPFAAGLVHAALGEEEAAFKAFRHVGRWSDWPTLSVHYYFRDVLDKLRDDPRYRDVLREVDRSWD